MPDNLPPVIVDASQIEQVLVNLFINAIQAMPEGGDLLVNGSYDPESDHAHPGGQRYRDRHSEGYFA